MLELQDILLTTLHYLIIGINVLAWIPEKTRKLHLITISITFFSWIILGFWKGLGYCFLVDWQWDIKRKLGETDLPYSFIQYQLEYVFGIDVNPALTDWVTGLVFVFAILIAIWQHFLHSVYHRKFRNG